MEWFVLADDDDSLTQHRGGAIQTDIVDEIRHGDAAVIRYSRPVRPDPARDGAGTTHRHGEPAGRLCVRIVGRLLSVCPARRINNGSVPDLSRRATMALVCDWTTESRRRYKGSPDLCRYVYQFLPLESPEPHIRDVRYRIRSTALSIRFSEFCFTMLS